VVDDKTVGSIPIVMKDVVSLASHEPQSFEQLEHDNGNVIQIPDDDFELPSTSGLIRGFQFNDDTNYDAMSMMDIDQEFSDFLLLSPGKDYDSQEDINYDNDGEQFSIIDPTGEFFFSLFNFVIYIFFYFKYYRSSII
jgi:hypothetical protein